MRQKAQQPRLINKLNYVPTIHPACIYDDKPSCLPLSSQPREPLNQLAFQQDERMLYKASFTDKSFENIGELLVEFLDSDCSVLYFTNILFIADCQYRKLQNAFVIILIFMSCCFKKDCLYLS